MVKHIQLLDPLIWIKDFNYQESWVVIIPRYVLQINPDNMLSEQHVVMDPQFSLVSELYMVTFKFQLCAILAVYIMQKACL